MQPKPADLCYQSPLSSQLQPFKAATGECWSYSRWKFCLGKEITLCCQFKTEDSFITNAEHLNNSNLVHRFPFIKNNLITVSGTVMLMSDGPWSPEHIYQEIVGYGKTRHRGKLDKILNISWFLFLKSKICFKKGHINGEMFYCSGQV